MLEKLLKQIKYLYFFSLLLLILEALKKQIADITSWHDHFSLAMTLILLFSFIAYFFRLKILPTIIWKTTIFYCLFIALWDLHSFEADYVNGVYGLDSKSGKYTITAGILHLPYKMQFWQSLLVVFIVVFIFLFYLFFLLSYLYPMYKLGFRSKVDKQFEKKSRR